jgi:hypothetical protein
MGGADSNRGRPRLDAAEENYRTTAHGRSSRAVVLQTIDGGNGTDRTTGSGAPGGPWRAR